MKGLRYVNKSNSSIVENCTRLEDELCNGGPTVWSRFNKTKVGLFKIIWLFCGSCKVTWAKIRLRSFAFAFAQVILQDPTEGCIKVQQMK